MKNRPPSLRQARARAIPLAEFILTGKAVSKGPGTARELQRSRLTITVRHMRFISYLAERLLQAVDERQRFLYE
jgi:deoxyxylulose-5-phosphate synthase